MFSRRHTREFLLQSLYSRSELKGDFDRASFIEAYFSHDYSVDSIDMAYVEKLEEHILTEEVKLVSIVAALAPKFELPTMPVMHILILMISLTELLHADLWVPEAVSVNEAIELAKTFSDTQGKWFINGALSTFLKEKDAILASPKQTDFHIFQK